MAHGGVVQLASQYACYSCDAGVREVGDEAYGSHVALILALLASGSSGLRAGRSALMVYGTIVGVQLIRL